MKASEMTNDELTNYLESITPDFECYTSPVGGYFREAAARLRKQGEIIKMAHVETRISAELRRRLKVAEDALFAIFKNTAYGEHFFSTTCKFVHEKADSALAAIRVEGGAK